jgi:hypothetical protein
MSEGYSDWLEARIQARCNLVPSIASSLSFSVLTCVYEKTVAAYFEETWKSLQQQDHKKFEWLVLAHGPISRDMDALLQRLEKEQQCRIFRTPENLGIVGGMRYCLTRAGAEYIVPLDADDLLEPDSLQAFAYNILRHDRPPFLYSDEDHFVEGRPASPFFRPDWDPILALSSSYVWHLCAMRRDRAIQLDVYGDDEANWCHDWDSLLRFFQAGDKIVHVPEILHHWRAHAASSTNRSGPESGSLKSQRYVLDRYIRTRLDPQLFEVQEFPLFRGATEYWIQRRREQTAPMDVVILGTRADRSVAAACALLRNARYCFQAIHFVGVEVSSGDQARISDLMTKGQGKARLSCWPHAQPRQLGEILAGTDAEYVVICSERIHTEGDEWPWECDGLFRCHRDLSIVAARILDPDGVVMGGAEILGVDGISGCPDAGRKDDDPGYFALALKPRSVSAPYSELFVARVSFLRASADLLSTSSWSSIGIWLGAIALERQQRVAVTPLFNGTLDDSSYRFRPGPEETLNFLNRFGLLVPDTRWYSQHFGWRRELAYSPTACPLPPSMQRNQADEQRY